MDLSHLTQKSVIGGHEFSVQKLTGTKALLVFKRVTGYAAPVLSAIADGVDSGDDNVDLTKIGAVIGDVLTRMPDSDFIKLRDDLLAGSRIDGKELTAAEFDLHFAGNIGDALALLKFALEVNFKDFFGSLKTRAMQLFTQAMERKAAPKSASPEPSRMSGLSGGSSSQG